MMLQMLLFLFGFLVPEFIMMFGVAKCD
jgi:hypothetical protein